MVREQQREPGEFYKPVREIVVMNNKNECSLKIKYYDEMAALDDAELGRMIRAAFYYADTGELIDCGDVANIILGMITSDIDAAKEQSERKAAANRENGRRGGRPKKEKPAVQEPPKPAEQQETVPPQQDPVQPPQQKPKRNPAPYTPGFEEVWKLYPRKEDKGDAYREYSRRLSDGYSPEELKTAAQRYADACKAKGTPKQYTKKGRTFFSVGGSFEDYLRGNAQTAPAADGYSDVDLEQLFGGG
jgi:hypothetical protein